MFEPLYFLPETKWERKFTTRTFCTGVGRNFKEIVLLHNKIKTRQKKLRLRGAKSGGLVSVRLEGEGEGTNDVAAVLYEEGVATFNVGGRGWFAENPCFGGARRGGLVLRV